MKHKDKDIHDQIAESKEILKGLLTPLRLLSQSTPLPQKRKDLLQEDEANISRLLGMEFDSQDVDNLQAYYDEILNELQRIFDDIHSALLYLHNKRYGFATGVSRPLMASMENTMFFLKSTKNGFEGKGGTYIDLGLDDLLS